VIYPQRLARRKHADVDPELAKHPPVYPRTWQYTPSTPSSRQRDSRGSSRTSRQRLQPARLGHPKWGFFTATTVLWRSDSRRAKSGRASWWRRRIGADQDHSKLYPVGRFPRHAQRRTVSLVSATRSWSALSAIYGDRSRRTGRVPASREAGRFYQRPVEVCT